jgi:prevent-host-death family protein
MDTVGIRQLREDLATYVTRARQGERLLVTDRGVPVAELVPVSEAVQGLWELVSGGGMTWGGGKPAGAQVPYRGPSMSDAISEDRR